MLKHSLVACTLLASSFSFPTLASSEFDDFKKQHLKESQQYSSQQKDEFKAYVNANKLAFKQYKEELSQVWGKDVAISDQTTWITHTDDLHTRNEVDFKKEEIRITLIVDDETDNEQITKSIEEQLKRLADTSVNQAQKDDPISKKVETIISAQPIAPKLPPKAKPDLKPVIQLTESPIDTVNADKEIEKLVQQAVIVKKPAPKPVKQLKQTNQKVIDKNVDKKRIVVTIPLPKVAVHSKAKRFTQPVTNSSDKWKIDSALVLAVIHSESSFNPMARSHIPAYGLMQIVPRSAGQDASALIYGNAKMLSSSYLYTSEKNINVGTAYLHILDKRYLRKITNPESRLYCVIAAYNTGAGNVARAFTGKTSVTKAAPKINSMTPFQVYNHLLRNLPHDETKDYLKRVSSRYEAYKKTTI